MSEQAIMERIKEQVTGNEIFLYMKGTPEAPQCGFSAQVVQILNAYNVEYKSSDVLSDWDIREGIKKYSNWPTIPQLYVGGKFVGGCDILMEMHRKGDLDQLLSTAAPKN